MAGSMSIRSCCLPTQRATEVEWGDLKVSPPCPCLGTLDLASNECSLLLRRTLALVVRNQKTLDLCVMLARSAVSLLSSPCP